MSKINSNDLNTASVLGQALTDAYKKYETESGKEKNDAATNTAAIMLDYAQQKVMSFMTAKKKDHDMVMELIRMFGR